MNKPFLMMLALAVLLLAGCGEDEQALRRAQAQRAEASRELVQADANARGEMVALQRDLQQGQVDLARQRDQLEDDRRQYADQRNRDPILANMILTVGILLACLLPLVLGIVLVLSLRDTAPTEDVLTQILVEEFAADEPLLLPGTSRTAALAEEPGKEDLTAIPPAGPSRPAITPDGMRPTWPTWR